MAAPLAVVLSSLNGIYFYSIYPSLIMIAPNWMICQWLPSQTGSWPMLLFPLKYHSYVYMYRYHSLGEISRRQTDDNFSYFLRKLVLTFYAKCLLMRQFAWNVNMYFLGKIRKTYFKMSSVEFFNQHAKRLVKYSKCAWPELPTVGAFL